MEKTTKKSQPKKATPKKGAPKKTAPKKTTESTKPAAIKITWKTFGWAIALLAWVGIALYASQFIISLIMVAILGVETVLQPVWSTVFSALVYILCLFLTIFIPWKLAKMKTSRDELGLTGLPTWTDILLSPVGFAVYYILAIIFAALFMSILPGIDWGQTQDVGFQNLMQTSDQILAFIALVVLAPIAEEIIFRGWLYGKLRGKLPAWLSIILVSVLFGVMHGQWNVGVNVFCMSVVMCLMREITGTIWSSILLHMIKNGVAFYFLFISPIV